MIHSIHSLIFPIIFAKQELDGVTRNHLLFLVARSFIDIPLYALHAEGFTTPRRNDRYADVPRRKCTDVVRYEWHFRKRELTKFISCYLYSIFLPTLFLCTFLSRQKYTFDGTGYFLHAPFSRFHVRLYFRETGFSINTNRYSASPTKHFPCTQAAATFSPVSERGIRYRWNRAEGCRRLSFPLRE